MTTKHRMFLGMLLAGALIAQPKLGLAAEQPPPVIPESSTQKAEKTPASNKDSATNAAGASLKPGPAIVISRNVNVRGQAAINSEVVAKLNKGDRVTVLEQVSKKPKPNEPAKWAKISLPPNTPVWVHRSFLDENRAVKPRRLNLRSGPGENYSVVGRIEKGALVRELETRGDWMKIEAPEGSYAFVAAHLLSSETVEPPAIAARTPREPVLPSPPPVETTVVTPPSDVVLVQPPPTREPAPVGTTPDPFQTSPPATTTAPDGSRQPIAQPVLIEDPTIKRLVTREGIVRRSASIQAPTYFVLESPINRRTINYIHSPSRDIVLKNYEGQRILVTGEELLDERWPNTPVINVETLEAMP